MGGGRAQEAKQVGLHNSRAEGSLVMMTVMRCCLTLIVWIMVGLQVLSGSLILDFDVADHPHYFPGYLC